MPETTYTLTAPNSELDVEREVTDPEAAELWSGDGYRVTAETTNGE